MADPGPSTPTCPVCGQVDQVLGLSALVARGSLPPALQQQLSPPAEPQLAAPLTITEIVATWMMGLVALPAVVLAVESLRQVASLNAEAPTDPLAAPMITAWRIVLDVSLLVFILCLFGFGLTVLRFYRRQSVEREALPERREEWKKALTTWERLYYCARCNGVFLPQPGGESRLVAVQYLPELVSQYVGLERPASTGSADPPTASGIEEG